MKAQYLFEFGEDGIGGGRAAAADTQGGQHDRVGGEFRRGGVGGRCEEQGDGQGGLEQALTATALRRAANVRSPASIKTMTVNRKMVSPPRTIDRPTSR